MRYPPASGPLLRAALDRAPVPFLFRILLATALITTFLAACAAGPSSSPGALAGTQAVPPTEAPTIAGSRADGLLNASGGWSVCGS